MRAHATLALLVSAIMLTSACRSSRDYLAEGDRLFAAKKYAESALIYRKAIQRDPQSAEAHYKLGLVQRATANYAAAYNSFRLAVTLNPDLDPAQIELGNLYLGDYLMETPKNPAVTQKIAAIAGRLLAKDPKSYAGLRFRGYLALSDRKPGEAVTYFQQAHAARPEEADVVLGLTQALLLAGRYQEARQTADNLIEQHKTFGSVYDVLYAYEMSSGHTSDAESLLKLKLKNNPQDRDAVLQLAEHYWRTNRRGQSFQLLDAMLHEGQTAWQVYVDTAQFYQQNREWDRAADALALGIKAHPDQSVAFASAQAQLLAAQGKPKQAIGLLSDSLQARPGTADLRRQRAVLLLDSGDAPDKALALRELQSLVQTSPGDTALAFQLGRAYSINGSPDKAKQQFEQVVQKEPGNIEALLALAQLCSETRKFELSLQYSERILQLQPRLRNARLLHATALVGLGRLTEAHLEYDRLVRAQPGYTEASLQLALLDVLLKRFPEAERMFRALYKPKTGDFRALEGIVALYVAQGQVDKALKMLNEEMSRYPDSPAVRRLLASTAAHAGKLELATREYEQLFSSNPEDRQICSQLGELYQRQHELSKSLAMFQKAVELAPGDWKAVGRLGAAQQESGRQAQAKTSYRRALELGGDDPDLLNNLAYIEAESGSDLDDAMTLVQKALARSPGNSQYTDTAGFIYLKKRDTASALQIFQQLSKRFPNDAGFRYHLALALLQSGDRAQGEQQLRTAVAADPSLADTNRVRSILSRH